ncbi:MULTISPECIES: class I SAM-dependent methyltransferase [unclassified Brevibacterium]|uniref:class I SAM-dependent methyltransferase n=1 Tax=unclassified Brevibacterium TaxID=2614124 RepID=UPI0010923A0B|nr:class I SAM-dependent methyltransferase [Brevibacterium sp. S22]TGD26483.1 class I SAM-dependent methyltransferase [Brevibacterium sp. S22]
MPDALYSHPRLARVYDPLDPDRSDLDAYLQVIEGVGAKTVLDVGCGTGTLISMLTELGLTALGVDPAEASIDVAREKVVSDLAEFVVGTVVDVAADPSRHGTFDLAAMTANVAQVFLDNDDWLANLCAIKLCLRPGGHIIFETRQPADRGWERWTKEQTHQVVHVEGEGSVEEWVQVTKVDGEFVTFESPTIFHRDGERIDSTSTLRFRSEDALERTLSDAGFKDCEVRDLPYAPGRGWLILAKS